MTRLWVMSDLHQELARFPWAPARPEFDVLVVAGDVFESDVARAVGWVSDLAGGRPSVLVPGNHEFWHDTLEAVLAKGREAAEARGVAFLDGPGWTEVGGVCFAGNPLWTDLSLGRPVGARLYPEDFGEPIVEMRGGRPGRASGQRMLDRHRADVAALEATLGMDPLPAGPRVVVTHHAPHERSLGPAGRSARMAAASASDLGHLLESGAADLWIHGHVHRNADYVGDGGTRVLCNPFGSHGSNAGFDEALVIDTAGFPRLQAARP